MITKKLLNKHKELNDVKGTERKILLISGSDIKITNEKEGKEEFEVNSFYMINWIAFENFITVKSNIKITLDKFKKLSFGTDPKELKAIENSWRNILKKASGDENTNLYVAYYIGGKNDIIVSEVGKLTKKEFEDQTK